MKKVLLTVIIMISSVVFAQYKSAAVKIGTFNPSATESGFMLGYEGGTRIDRNLTVGWSVDWFNKEYIDQRLVSEYNDFYGISNYTVNEVRAKTNLHDIPVMMTFTARFPFQKRLSFFATGAIGAEVLLINYRNYEFPDDDEIEWAFDFSWRLGGGMAYKLGRRSEIFGELFYHNSEPSWEYEVEHNGRKRIFERVFDMSGVAARLGIRFYY